SAVNSFSIAGRISDTLVFTNEDVTTVNGNPVTNYTYLTNVSGLAGVTVKAGGISTVSATNGAYLLTGVPAGSNAVTATRSGYGFSPNPNIVNLTSDTTNVDFTWYLIISIGGRITENGHVI